MTVNGTKMLLPVEAYISREWFDREQRELFGRSWQFAGMTTDIVERGQYICVQAGAYPLIVIRDDEGELKAYHNICRHRGTQLLEVTGKHKKVITCPYHDWVYSLDGKLIGVPQRRTQFPDLDMSEWSLFPASVAVWNEMVFVNPNAECMPFDKWLGDFPDHFGPHRPSQLMETDVRHYEIKANWKIFVENYIDVYHLSHLHSETLNMYDHAKLKSAVTGPGHVATYDPPTREYKRYLETSPNNYMPLAIQEAENWGAYVHMMFPNFGIAGTEYSWSTIEVMPVTPRETLVKIRTRTALEGINLAIANVYEKVGAWVSQAIGYRPDADPLQSGDFMVEDIYACEQQQKAMESPRFAFGPTSIDQEQLIIDFQNAVLSYMPDPED